MVKKKQYFKETCLIRGWTSIRPRECDKKHCAICRNEPVVRSITLKGSFFSELFSCIFDFKAQEKGKGRGRQ